MYHFKTLLKQNRSNMKYKLHTHCGYQLTNNNIGLNIYKFKSQNQQYSKQEMQTTVIKL